MWLKLTASEENWRSVDKKHQYISVLIKTETILALKEIPPAEDENNKTLIYIAHSGIDGWLEIPVTSTVDEILVRL